MKHLRIACIVMHVCAHTGIVIHVCAHTGIHVHRPHILSLTLIRSVLTLNRSLLKQIVGKESARIRARE